MQINKSDSKSQKIVIIDYGAGNVFSVKNAFKTLGVEAVVSDHPDKIREADKVIFPGVGAAGNAMKQLENKNLIEIIQRLQQPVLGICLGMQLLMDFSEEDNTTCMGIISGSVKKFRPFSGLRVPHMGWNSVSFSKEHRLFQGWKAGEWAYFVHSYYVAGNPFTIGITEYQDSFTSVLEKGNFIGVQFHPEKSAESGLRLLQNFIELY
jgi:glutamine amidotransferase